MTKQVFIIPGWTYSLDKYKEFKDKLGGLGIDVRLLKVPGLTQPSDKTWDINSYIEWLDKELSAVKRPVVIGHSNGGRIVLSYIQKYPNRLKQLILIDSAGVAHNEKRSQFKLANLRLLAKVGKSFAFVPGLREFYYKVIGARDYYNATPNMRLTMQNMLRADQLIDLSKVTLPTTIIWGREDSVTPLDDGQKLHDAIKGSKLFIIDDARHSPHANYPDEVAQLVAKALEEN